MICKHSSTKIIFQNLTNFFRFEIFFFGNFFTENVSPPSILNIFLWYHLQMKDIVISHIIIKADFSIGFAFFDLSQKSKKSDLNRKEKNAKSNNRSQYLYVQNRLFFHLQVVPLKILRIKGGGTFFEKKHL